MYKAPPIDTDPLSQLVILTSKEEGLTKRHPPAKAIEEKSYEGNSDHCHHALQRGIVPSSEIASASGPSLNICEIEAIHTPS